MITYESLLETVIQLPVADRIQLIETIWDTIADDGLPPLSEEWLTEIERRSAEFDAGKATPIPWSEVKANAISRLDQQRE